MDMLVKHGYVSKTWICKYNMDMEVQFNNLVNNMNKININYRLHNFSSFVIVYSGLSAILSLYYSFAMLCDRLLWPICYIISSFTRLCDRLLWPIRYIISSFARLCDRLLWPIR